ncbi:MAG: septal ring lytic transglycosylase RlpA family protein [Desulfatibacillaceae bacterium]|nr:septal ring lytic transglycosylase RlpA family protein [Desulfatibacillaceae bacterium]
MNFAPKKTLAVLALVVAALFALSLAGCARKAPTGQARPPAPAPQQPQGYPKPYQVFGQWYQPIPNAKGFKEKGLASWYGKDFHGKKTANGEIYDMYAMTAAHKTLPLGTRVKVTNTANNREIFVRINDRGPFVKGRIIDLSHSAAEQLDVIRPGTAPVIVEAVAAPPGEQYARADVYYRGDFTVQVGAFADVNNARNLAAELGRNYKNVTIQQAIVDGRTFHRVRVGRSKSLEEAAAYEKALVEAGFAGAFVVAD